MALCLFVVFCVLVDELSVAECGWRMEDGG